MKKMKQGWQRFFLISIILILLFQVSQVSADEARKQTIPDKNKLYARSAVLMDAESGRVLFGKNEKEVHPMASTTKIMTLILTLEHADLEEIVEVSKYAASMPDVQLNMREGEKYKLRDLLYSLMLESHNDSAVAIAEHVGGSVEKFAKMMNTKAEEIGCQNTWFITPNGLDASEEEKEHSTTAEDLALIMSYCIKKSSQKDTFLEITRTSNYSFSAQNASRTFQCVNHNAFLHMMEGALSGKTGFTAKAGYCYVGALESEGRTFVVALLACGWPNHKTYKWSDTRKLMEYGMESYQYRTFFSGKRTIHQVAVIGGKEEFANLALEGETSILAAEKEKMLSLYYFPERIPAPLEAGEAVGTVKFYIHGFLHQELLLKTEENINKINFYDVIKKLIWNYLLLW